MKLWKRTDNDGSKRELKVTYNDADSHIGDMEAATDYQVITNFIIQPGYSAGMMKDMDRVTTGISAMMAWCEDHTNEILVAGDVQEYLKSDEYSMEFSHEMLENANSDDEIREYLIERHRAYVEKCMACEEQGHDWQETADPENGISEMDCQRCGETMTLSW